MTIQVLGSGCPTCKSLYEITQKAVKELDLDIEIEYITDITKMIEMGIMTSPVLIINGEPVMYGFSNNIEKIKDIIINGNEQNTPNKDCCEDCDNDSNCKCTSDCKCK